MAACTNKPRTPKSKRWHGSGCFSLTRSIEEMACAKSLLPIRRESVGVRQPGEVEPLLRALRVEVDSTGAPLDPSGTAYVLISEGCDLDVDPKSEVPSR